MNDVLQSEGGFVDNPHDDGGATMKGITLAVYRVFKKNAHLTKDDLKNISNADIQSIYMNQYWTPAHCNDLASGVYYCVFDFAINAGVGRSIKTLQKCLGTTPDGLIGSATLEKANQSNKPDLINSFCDAREAFYKDLVAARPDQSQFLEGWMNRVEKVRQQALNLFNSSPL
jgi:lysozyme family protein